MEMNMQSIIIKKIDLINYRQFIKQTIEFNNDSKGNIVIIQGENGFGKSNIYNAINWCFFGVEEHLRSDAHTLPVCNTKIFNKLKPETSTETIVRITLDTPSGEKEIERKHLIYKNKDGKPYVAQNDLNIMEVVGKNWKIAPNPEYIISRILPKNMRHFFFIDGEKLRQLFENIKSDQIKKSIFELSQISLLQNATDHLSYFKNVLRKGIDLKREPDLSQYQEYLDRLQKTILNNKEQLVQLKNEVDEAYINKSKLDQELQELDIEHIKTLETQRRGLEEKINILQKNYEEKEKAFFSDLIRMAPPIIILKAIKSTLNIISDLQQENKLPPTIQQTFLEDLLANMKCICGADLRKEENMSCKKTLEELLEKAKYSDMADDILKLKFELKSLLIEEGKVDDVINKYELSIHEIKDELNASNKRLKEVKTKIGEVDYDKVKTINEDRNNLEKTIGIWLGKIGKLEVTISTDEKKYKEIETLYNKELAKKDKYKIVINKLKFCDHAMAELQKVKEKLMDEIRDEAEKNTQDYFNKLISSKKFSPPRISDNYELIVEKDGFNAVTSLSAAETLCMGYSFMAALRKTSGFLAPIVIDTPLAKIDKKYRLNVAEWLKNALYDAQVILLVTDSEYTKEFRDAILPCVRDEFILKHDKNAETSEVIRHAN